MISIHLCCPELVEGPMVGLGNNPTILDKGSRGLRFLKGKFESLIDSFLSHEKTVLSKRYVERVM